MTWEKRAKSDYYYRKYRLGDRVYSKYIGKGPEVDLLAEEDIILRNINQAQKKKRRQGIETEKLLDRRLDMVTEEVTSLMNAILLASGYRTHRGQWRKQRE